MSETDADESPLRDAELLLVDCPPEKREQFAKVTRRALEGPRKRHAAIKLACYQCANWNQYEVTNCHITKCALWDLRLG